MKVSTSKVLPALPALTGVQASPSIRSNLTAAVDSITSVELLGLGSFCGWSAPSRDTICGYNLCCSSEDSLCGSGPRACGPDNCNPLYSTGCDSQRDINPHLQTDMPEQGPSSPFQKRQVTTAQDANTSSPSSNQLYTRPSLSWLTRLSRPKLGSVPYGELITTCNEPGTVALTFDDGPWEWTEELLNILRDYEAKATFFVCGGNMDADEQITGFGHPQLLRRMASEGHQVGTHTFAHPDLALEDDYGILDELLLNEQAIVQALERIPTYFRPPYFSYDDEVLSMASELGYHVINANVDTNDWQGDYDAARQAFSQAVQQGADGAPGMIVLAHDIHERTVHELAAYMIEQARDAGFRLVTVGECLGDPQENWYRNPRTGDSLSHASGGSQLAKRDEIPGGQGEESSGNLHKLPLIYHQMPPIAVKKLNAIAARAGGVGEVVTAGEAVAVGEAFAVGEAAEPVVENAMPDGSEERMVAGGPSASYSNAVGSSSPKATFGLVLALVSVFFFLH